MRIDSTKKKTRTGTLAPHGDGWRGRLRLADGTKSKRFDLPAGLTEDQARATLRALQAEEDRTGQVLAAKRDRAREDAAKALAPHELETCDTWHARLLDSGTVSTSNHAADRWAKWVSPIIGAAPIATVGRDDIERLRDELDAAILRHRASGRAPRNLMPKSALNVWSLVTRAFRHAQNSKVRSLRVRSDNPTTGVLPPERGDGRRRTFLYPVEVAQLLACPDVPRQWREVYAVAVYTYLRPGELVELRFSDVDLEAGVLHITRSFDWTTKEAKPPKTSNGIRTVPIPSSLLPLLRARAKGAPREALVLPELLKTGEFTMATRLREHLRLAGVDRAQLSADNATHMPVNFRSCRDTGITWLALAGVDVARMQRRAGHDDITTTLGYVKLAEDFGGLLGTPFEELPSGLLDQALAHQTAPHDTSTRNRSEVLASPGGFEPPLAT